MKIIRKLNVFLLIVAIILMVVFICIDAPKEKYGNYNKEINITATRKNVEDMWTQKAVDVYLLVRNNGKQDIEGIVLDIEIQNKLDLNQKITLNTDIKDYLSALTEADVMTTFFVDTDSWLVGKSIDQLIFTFKIKSIEFADGQTYHYS